MNTEKAISFSFGENGHGELIILSCGRSGTIGALFKVARNHGFDGCRTSFAARVQSGCRDFAKLCAPVELEKSKKNKSARKKKMKDPEFLAALAAVSARNGKRQRP